MMNIEDLQVGDIVEFWYIKYNQQINEQDYYRKYRH